MYSCTLIASLIIGLSLASASAADSVVINQLSPDAVAAAPLTEAPKPQNAGGAIDYQQTILSNPYANSLANMDAIAASNAKVGSATGAEMEGEAVQPHDEDMMLNQQGNTDTLNLIMQESTRNSVKYKQSGQNNKAKIVQSGDSGLKSNSNDKPQK